MDGRKRRNPSDLSYFIAKEILNGERTYKKDLEVICVHLKEELSRADDIPPGLLQNLFSLLQPIHNSQGTLLVEIEHRLSTWESRGLIHKSDTNHIGDLLLKQNDSLDQYSAYLTKLPELLQEIDTAFRKIKPFEQLYKNFELEKLCYLPITAFMLKPAQRLLQYQNSLERLLNHYGSYHSDVGACEAALHNFRRAGGIVHDAVKHAEHFSKLVELQRDLLGIDNLAVPAREFVREGILHKISKKGHDHLRMFILLTDTLLYTERASNTTAQFKLHGQMSIRGMMVKDSESETGLQHCFTIFSGNRNLLVAANSTEEKFLWLHDLQTVIEQSKRLAYDKLLQYGSLKSCSSTDEVLDKLDLFPISPAHTDDTGTLRAKSPLNPVISSRSNTTLHVCWHRNTTVSVRDLSRAFQLQLNGYLLRKFKNSDGWQKLWVVFTNFCLFFFKNNMENAPLACLPLIGYRIAVPSAEDNILKEHVFKLYFKTHVYFFRTDSQFTFSRWMDVIGAATEPDRSSDSPDMNGTGMQV